MSVSPISGITNVSSPLQPTAAQIAGAQATVPGSATATAAQSAPTADAAQAWEEAMRAAMGDESATATPATATTVPATTTTAPTTGTTAAAAQSALTPEALAALVSGGSSATTSPLITSLSAPVSDADVSSYI